MTTHAQPIGTPSESPGPEGWRHAFGLGRNGNAGKGDSVSVAKFGMFGAIGTAFVTAAASIFVAFSGDDAPDPVPGGGAGGSGQMGSIDEVTVNSENSKVTVTGWAAPNVESVVVAIGPRESGGQYWAASADVFQQEWKLDVATPPELSRPYEVKAYYKQRANGSAGIQSVVGYAFSELEPAPAPPPPPSPGQLADCVEQYGASCFQSQPGWDSTSTYESGQ